MAMRFLSLLIPGILISISCDAQFTIPKLIPCVTLNSSNLSDLEPLIEAFDCIENEEGETITFDPALNVELKAGKYIELSEETTIEPTTGSFTARIVLNQPDVVWYQPNSTPGTVGRYDKLEFGVRFNSTIEQEIKNYLDTLSGPKLNPYDPLDIDLKAEFWYYSETFDLFLGPVKSYGFYFEDYVRTTDDWTKDTLNQYHFRIRFAPPLEGLWQCKVSAFVEGHGDFEAPEFTFNCTPSGNPGYMRVGDNGRYFRVGNEPFYPVGTNIISPGHGFIPNGGQRAKPEHYKEYDSLITVLADKGGNYFRYISTPWSNEPEFPALGNYTESLEHLWEFDNLLDTIKELDLKMHFNMQIHYALELNSIFGHWRWDWNAIGDPITPSPWPSSCSPPLSALDSGYCYRRELDLEDPKDFFTNPDAIKHYKNRLRYIVARWGYSTEIGVMELFSEINNAGNEILWDNNLDSCKVLFEFKKFSLQPYEDTLPGWHTIIQNWQIGMLQFIRDSLEHNQHPLAVNYAGAPKESLGDNSFSSPYVDVMTYNHYQLLVRKYTENFDRVDSTQTFPFKIKPMMHSEYGPGPNVHACANDTRFIKGITLLPFTGLAAGGMLYGNQKNEDDVWKYLAVTKDFMEGIKLDEENWSARQPQVAPGKEVEMLYLRNLDEDGFRAAGVISNRTYNYHSQETGFPCNFVSAELDSFPIYIDEANFISADLDDPFSIPGMHKAGTILKTKYNIQWFNAITGDLIFSEIQKESGGDLAMKFPFLSGSAEQPIVFFQVFPEDEPSFKSQSGSTTFEDITYEISLPNDSTLYKLEPTDWDNSIALDNMKVLVTPNPATDLVTITLIGNEFQDAQWHLINVDGAIFLTGAVDNPNFRLDLSVYASGTYFFIISTSNNKYVQKIIKNKILLLQIIGALFFTFSCKKQDSLKDELTEEKSIFVGKWVWSHSDHLFGFCDGEFWEETLSPFSEGTTFSLQFTAPGMVYYYKNDSLISEYRIKFKSFEPIPQECMISNANPFHIYLDGNSQLALLGCLNSDTIRASALSGFLFNSEPGCEIYANYFVKE
ncbi:T9SS type A sorting domain-containing protein [Crocinitomix catalasitica]|nr:T9SS type A sorting domain-containing protein [Crocinitomix catalasitica]